MKEKLTQIPIHPPNGFTGQGRFGNPGADSPGMLDTILSVIIGTLTAIAFIWFTIQFFIGAITWITSGGDKGKVESAKSKITHNLIGLVVVVSAIFLIDLVGTLLGIDILEIPTLIDTLSNL